MTIETLNAIKAEAETLQAGIDNFAQTITNAEFAGVEIPQEVDDAYAALNVNLGIIYTWVLQAIEDGTVEEPEMQVMASFLAELKLVFEKYSATLRIIESADGYGLDYGGSGAENVIQFTVSRDGTTEVKDFIQTSLIAADLI